MFTIVQARVIRIFLAYLLLQGWAYLVSEPFTWRAWLILPAILIYLIVGFHPRRVWVKAKELA